MEGHSKVAYPGLVEAEEGEVFAVGREPKDLRITVDFCSLSIPIHSFIEKDATIRTKLTLFIDPVWYAVKDVRTTIFSHPCHSPVSPHIQIVLPHERDAVPGIIPPSILYIPHLILY